MNMKRLQIQFKMFWHATSTDLIWIIIVSNRENSFIQTLKGLYWHLMWLNRFVCLKKHHCTSLNFLRCVKKQLRLYNSKSDWSSLNIPHCMNEQPRLYNQKYHWTSLNIVDGMKVAWNEAFFSFDNSILIFSIAAEYYCLP